MLLQNIECSTVIKRGIPSYFKYGIRITSTNYVVFVNTGHRRLKHKIQERREDACMYVDTHVHAPYTLNLLSAGVARKDCIGHIFRNSYFTGLLSRNSYIAQHGYIEFRV